jgi:dTDP-4-dehydrorhamnose reductase
MKVLITGAGGQVGRALISCTPRDVQPIPCTRTELDIADESVVRDRVRRAAPDLIINAAAYTAVDRAEAQAAEAYRINADGAGNLARAALESGAVLIQLSTDFVFDGRSSSPYRPDSPTGPLSVYGKSKLAGEATVLERLPGRAVVLRTAWIYASEGQNFVRTMLRLMREQGSVRVVADQVGTPTAAASVAEAIWAIAARPDIRGIHHWTDAGVASWFDFAVAIAEEAVQLGILSQEPAVVPITTAQYPTAARRPAYSVLEKSSLLSLGLAPTHWRKRLRTVLREVEHA